MSVVHFPPSYLHCGCSIHVILQLSLLAWVAHLVSDVYSRLLVPWALASSAVREAIALTNAALRAQLLSLVLTAVPALADKCAYPRIQPTLHFSLSV